MIAPNCGIGARPHCTALAGDTACWFMSTGIHASICTHFLGCVYAHTHAHTYTRARAHTHTLFAWKSKSVLVALHIRLHTLALWNRVAPHSTGKTLRITGSVDDVPVQNHITHWIQQSAGRLCEFKYMRWWCSSGAVIMIMFASPFETRVVDGALVHCVCVVQISIQQRLRIGASLCCRGGSRMWCKKNLNKNQHLNQNFHLLYKQQVFIYSFFFKQMCQWTPDSP